MVLFTLENGAILEILMEILEILMHSAGQPRTNLVIAPCRLKWINLSHVSHNFSFNTFIVVELQIKMFISENALELAAVFS